MKLNHGIHLAYCTNIHRGESWLEIFAALEQHTLAVRERIAPGIPYAIGLRLSDRASLELMEPATLTAFRQWLDKHNCYVFTINGFPYGKFHGGRVKEQVYAPDWTTPERLAYTNRLFDILAKLLPKGVEGSVSTVPCSFKEFIHSPEQEKAMRDNLWHCVEHIARVSQETGHMMHLGLEPEPLCFLETTAETIRFFDTLTREHHFDARIRQHLGVNYDTCHLAVEYEDAAKSLQELQSHQIRISKLHLSNALKVTPTLEARTALAEFADDIYLHQVIVRDAHGRIIRFKDLDLALTAARYAADHPHVTESGHHVFRNLDTEEWRIHFHIPLHAPVVAHFGNTADHLLGALDWLKANPTLCSHLEMETYTWEVMPPEFKNRSVVDQLVMEYCWTLQRLGERSLANIEC